MFIRQLNGKMLVEMIQIAQKHLMNNKEKINELNVFPVPDGDTGTNMSLTMTSGMKAVTNLDSNDVSIVASAFSKGLLMGARGNSGVILSQLFRGFSSGIEGKSTLEASDLAQAFSEGVTSAYKAVTNPVEGTILTVAKDAAHEALNNHDHLDIIELMALTTEEASASLKRTPDLLPVLKEVGVVDSGGKGLVVIYEGFLAALKGEKIENEVMDEVNFEKELKHQHNQSVQSFIDVESIEHGYCTEFIVDLDDEKLKVNHFNESDYREELTSYGDSLLVAADDGFVKIHIHTEIPGDVMSLSQKYGDLMNIDVENMRKQHEAIMAEDSNLNIKREESEVAKIVVSVGKGIHTMFKSLGADYIIEGGQTMNPSTEDIVKAIELVNAKEVYILPNNKNIILSAEQAAEIVEQKVHVIPTKTIPQGIASLFAFEEEADSTTNSKNMCGATQDVKTGLITYAVRDTEVNNLSIKKGHYMGLNDDTIQVTDSDKVKTVKALLSKLVSEEDEILTVFYGTDMTNEEKEAIEIFVKGNFDDVEAEFHDGGQPVYSLIIMVE